MSVKIGCAVWTLMEPNYKAPYEDAIRKVAKAGFEGIELMVNDAQEMEDYWTDSKVEEIRELLADLKLELTQLCVFQNMIGGLADLDKTISQNALKSLESVFVLAKKLNAPSISFPAPYPENDIRVRTTATLPEYYYLNIPDIVTPGGEPRETEGWRFDAKFRLYFKEGFKWQDYWDNFAENMQKVARMAEKFGIVCCVENKYNTMTPHTDSVIRILKRIQSNWIKVNFNCAQAFIQREILPWSIHRYGKYLAHVRACDGDGLACYNLPIGEGIIYWEGILEALDEIGYDGYISFEWLNDAEKEEHAEEALAYLKKKIDKVQKNK